MAEIEGLCSLFNITFSSASPLGFSLYRYPEEWRGRYILLLKSREYEDVVVFLIKEYEEIVASTIVTLKKVIIKGEELVGAFLDDVAVHPRYQGRGLGREILEAADNFIGTSDADFSALFTIHGEKAYRIYLKMGYVDANYLWLGFRIVNKFMIKNLVSKGVFRFLKPLIWLISRRRVPEIQGVDYLEADKALKIFNEMGQSLDLYSKISKARLERASIIAYKDDSIALGSYREFINTKNYRAPIGIVSSIVSRNNDSLTQVLAGIIRELERREIAAIITHTLSGEMLRSVKKAGFYTIPNKLVMMIKPVKRDVELCGEKTYLPTEHIIGEW